MNSISFGSNYRFNVEQNFSTKLEKKLLKFKPMAYAYENISPNDRQGDFFISLPDKFDKKIEALLVQKGIKFNKQTFDEALNLENIVNRTIVKDNQACYGYILEEFDTEKIDKLFQKDKASYIAPNGTNGVENKYEEVGIFLKTGQEFWAPQVRISEYDGKVFAIMIDGRHRFAYLRDMGLKKIPLSVKPSSYYVAKKHGLI